MNVVQLLLCVTGRHARDRHKAQQRGSDFHSVCTGCGQPMIRGPNGWLLTRDDDYLKSLDSGALDPGKSEVSQRAL